MNMDESGRKNRVVISAVVFETIKVLDPIKFYQPMRIHLLASITGDDEKTKDIYKEFHNHVRKKCNEFDFIRDKENDIKSHNISMRKFTPLLSKIINIIENEWKKDHSCEIYVNITSGTPEYVAAATLASMMSYNGTGEIIPFSVDIDSYTIPPEKIREVYFDDVGTPVGITKTVKNPRIIPVYPVNKPEERLIRALRIFDKKTTEKKRSPSNTEMICTLKEKGLWKDHLAKNDSGEKVHYQRSFIDKWKNLKWIVQDESNNKKYLVTLLGKTYIDTFYKDDS